MFRPLLISLFLICSATSAKTPLYEDFKLLASDGTSGDYFGISVAISDNIVAVGAHGDEGNGPQSGSAYIYRFDGKSWIETKLIASDGEIGDRFGESIAISGDTVVVGAPFDDHNDSGSGSAYIYRYDGKSWIETKLLASDGAYDHHFGCSVATSGNTVVVGAYGNNDNGFYSGSAYVYRFDGKSWIETKLLASDGAIGGNFGWSVATSGNTVVVGAWGDDDNGSWSGSAYIYRFDGKSWIETKLQASDGGSHDYFGWSVATSGNTVVVGANQDDGNDDYSGSAYIYRFDGKSWIETKLIASDGASGDHFGSSVSTNGYMVVVGAFFDNDNGSDSGSAYIYRFDGVNWIEDKLLASDGDSSDEFGNCVAISGDTVIVGAHYDGDNHSGYGAAYVFSLTNVDNDGDGVPNDIDNCYLYNPDQADCNENDVGDVCDIAEGTSTDWNGNEIPDDCECLADVNTDGNVNVNDLLIVIGNWGSSGIGDINADGIVDVSDLLIVVGNWGPCE